MELLSKEVDNFVNDNIELIKKSNLTSSEIGHSFWLSRNRYGSGFFDYNIPKKIKSRLDNI